jgi:hypothetical protein
MPLHDHEGFWRQCDEKPSRSWLAVLELKRLQADGDRARGLVVQAVLPPKTLVGA